MRSGHPPTRELVRSWTNLVRIAGAALGSLLLVATAASCQTLPVGNTCDVNGKVYGIGETFPVPGHCHGCTCRESRGRATVTCKAVYCSQETPIVDKVDVLFVVDNSAHMADKQAYLADAAGRLVIDLATPECVDEAGAATGERANPAAAKGAECQRGTPRHPPVVDMHIGVMSSSLGGYGSDQCRDYEMDPSDATLNAHKDDYGRLLNRRGPKQTSLPKASPSNFLAWFPPVPANTRARPSLGATPYDDLAELARDTTDLVEGVGHTGCRFSSPLEAAYRFLVAPNPRDRLARGPELDTALLAQRATFLRADSALAVVLVTDQDDVSLDPGSIGGKGAAYFESTFPLSANVPGAQRDPSRGGSTAPRGTTLCLTDPGAADCKSCGYRLHPAVVTDPRCRENEGFHAGDDDDLAVRFHAVKQRFGLDPRYPLKRYVDGFTRAQVPDSGTEHDGDGNYIGTHKCRNPLFARDLPLTASGLDDVALCNLERGPRNPEHIVVAVLGGVPDDLVRTGRPTDEAWTAIVGRPGPFDSSRIDARMVPAVSARIGRPPSASPADREFDTKKLELQYACTFPLPAPRTCTGDDPSCPCDGQSDIPICDGSARTHGKAVPSTRPFELAFELRHQAIVGSVCPASTPPPREGEPASEIYGYRRTMRQLADAIGPRLKK